MLGPLPELPERVLMLPGWLAVHKSTREPDTLIICDSARRPGDALHWYRVRIMRSGVVTLVRWRPTEQSARELYERTVECHENGLPQP